MNHKATLELQLHKCLDVFKMYSWLLDLFVLDYFVDNHWDRLPMSWKNIFKDLDPRDLGRIMVGHSIRAMLPLSFLSLLKTIEIFSLPRNKDDKCVNNSGKYITGKSELICENHPKLQKLFLKHVKLKKRHEISLMAEVVHKTSRDLSCQSVIDFGSGLGHLVRVLAYKYNMYTVGIECQKQLTDEARKLDLELEYTTKKLLPNETFAQLKRPTHLNLTLKNIDQLDCLPLPEIISNYGLIGLHPCGDLGPLLLQHFITSPNVKFICVVGCCYMKLSCCNGGGYPMSQFVKAHESDLSYTVREISCHSLDVYCDRLIKGDYKDLKIHAYRASLERILVGINTKFKHAPVRSIKHSDSMNFKSYCKQALERLNTELIITPSMLAQAEVDLAQWRRVVVLYTLRLSLAPIVETIILLDRVLYVLEHGYQCEIHPVFDPRLSPRNHIIVGRKK